MDKDSKTRVSLLLQLGDDENPFAWQQFVERYGPMIYQWCRHWNLQEADAEDVTQSLMVKLFEKLKLLDYDPAAGRFRGWLKTVTQNAVRDFCRRQRPITGDEEVWNSLRETPAQQDFVSRIERAYDLELLDQAKEIVRQRVAPHTWRAYELCEEGRQSTDEIAAETGLRVTMVYVAKSKVIKMLREEVSKLE